MTFVTPLKCKICDEYASPGAQIFFALASDVGQKDFTCNKCEQEVLEQVKDVERAIPWSDEMDRTDERWNSKYEQRSKANGTNKDS